VTAGANVSDPDRAYRERLAAGDPAATKALGGLIDRLQAAGLLVRPEPALAGATPGGEVSRGLEISGLDFDSRAVRPGGLFVAVRGEHVDGHDFVEAARANGAVAAIVERQVDVALPQIVVNQARDALATAATWWYGDPSARLGVVGITGTDGKTTTSRLLGAALDSAGWQAGIVSTVGGRVGGVDELHPPHATTPQAPELQRALAAMLAAGDRAAVIETTSHGLALGRVNGVRYDIAVLTNVTHEHLDLHGTWEAYRDAKRSLFARLAIDAANPAKNHPGWPRTGVLNADDPSFELFAETTRAAGARLLTYGQARAADLRLTDVDDDGSRLRVAWDGPSGPRRIDLQLAGRFNAYNALATAAVGEAVGLDPKAVDAGLEGFAGVTGRMERVELGQPFGVTIDYAHSPKSLEVVLDELAPLAAASGGGLIAVIGSAGERDIEKRGRMGRIAAERSQLVVVTDEDPRDEDPMAIIDAIADGAKAAGAVEGRSVLRIRPRADAIRAAIRAAQVGDVVLLAGKGHENTILGPNGREDPWNEREAAVAALRELGFGPP
jgi:UDP-N-acetylmuramoyl-L-alanyl-D-glutamate--2,6-diaminopimelate ligase